MRVNVYQMVGDAERSVALNVALRDAVPEQSERAHVASELEKQGRAWLGGGAGPLFLLMLQR